MFDAKNTSELDQAIALLRDHFVPSLWSFYSACMVCGFDKEQSMQLLLQWMTVTLLPTYKPKRTEE